MNSPAIVQEGKDGWIFLTGGTNNVLKLYSSSEGLEQQIIDSWVDLIVSRQETLSKLGICYLHLFAPEKLSVYPEYFNTDLQDASFHPLGRFSSSYQKACSQTSSGNRFVNPLNYFEKQKKFFQLYWKTDSHWRFEGCYCAYQLICSSLGVQAVQDLHTRPFSEGMVTFDLGGKLDPIVREKGRFYHLIKNAQRVGVNSIVEYKEANNLENEGRLHVGSNVIFRNEDANVCRKKVILFGDSFSEYRTTLLSGMLAETFEEFHFVWSTSLDYSYIERVKPDIVLSECAERFMARVPADDFDLENYSKQRLSEFD